MEELCRALFGEEPGGSSHPHRVMSLVTGTQHFEVAEGGVTVCGRRVGYHEQRLPGDYPHHNYCRNCLRQIERMEQAQKGEDHGSG